MGGIEAHCEALFPRIKALRPRDEIVVFGRSPYVPKNNDSYHGLKIRSVFTIRNKYLEALLHTLLTVCVARKSYPGAILHIHGIGPALATPLARLLGFDVVVTHHGADYNRAKWNRFARSALRFGESIAIRNANKIIVVSHSLTETLKAQFPAQADKIDYIPNGAQIISAAENDGEDFTRFLAEHNTVPGGYILAVARLVPEKGLHDLIDAFEKSDTRAQLLIAGGVDHVDSYARALMARGNARVRFLGRQPRDMVEKLYANASLFVMPSSHEGLPIAALEAASAGAPLLLSDIQPNLDLGLARANYFPQGDVAALAEALAVEPGTYQIDLAPLLERFNWDAVAAATNIVYQNIVKSASKRRTMFNNRMPLQL
ncbi:MAG: glycosyltransferase family 4 protein [Sphingobium sp.]